MQVLNLVKEQRIKELPLEVENGLLRLIKRAEATLEFQRGLEHGLEEECIKRGMTQTHYHNACEITKVLEQRGYEVEHIYNKLSDLYPIWCKHYDSKSC